jgi:hypothetical protein
MLTKGVASSVVESGDFVYEANSQIGDLLIRKRNLDQCISSAIKALPGQCGCSVAETDANKNGTADCIDVQLKLRKPSIAKVQKKVRITFPTKASISYRYTYKFLDRRYRIIRRVTGSSISGDQLNLSIPKGAVSITLSFVAKGRGYKNYQSPEYTQRLDVGR